MQVAADDGSHYTNGWTAYSDGGRGFDQWVFRATNTVAWGGAGCFLAGPGDLSLNYIGSTNNRAWGTYANGTNGWQAVAAFRGFGWDGARWTNALDSTGDVFAVSMENDNIDDGGSVGFALRHGNADFVPDNYNAGARFEFVFVGGDANYTIYAGTNRIDTHVQHRNSGLRVEVHLLSADRFRCRIIDYFDAGLVLNTVSGDLGGSGSIDSVALFNRNSSEAAFNNTYFNSMEIIQDVLPPPPTVLSVH